MLNSIPLLTAILGVFFLVILLSAKGSLRKNRRAWLTLVFIVVLAIHAQLDAYLYYNGLQGDWVGLSVLHAHLMGGLFLFFSHFLFQLPIKRKAWIIMLIAYTLIRTLLFIPSDPTVYENYSEEASWVDLGLLLDYFLSSALNIAGLCVALMGIRKLQFQVEEDRANHLHYLWLKHLLTVLIGLYVAMAMITLASLFYAEHWLTFWKIESMISGFFFFLLAFLAIRFPLFAVYGNFEDLNAEEKKYAKSSLTEVQSQRIWTEINEVMNKEKRYRNSTYRLNELAVQTGHSVHHVSQSINEHGAGSFADFLNDFRVAEAKSLLRSSRSKEVTILAIAYESGFNSKTAFYNVFKKVTGQTPSQFMRQHSSNTLP